MMTDNERAVIEAAVEWQHILDIYGNGSTSVRFAAEQLTRALNELHNEHDGKWRPIDG